MPKEQPHRIIAVHLNLAHEMDAVSVYWQVARHKGWDLGLREFLLAKLVGRVEDNGEASALASDAEPLRHRRVHRLCVGSFGGNVGDDGGLSFERVEADGPTFEGGMGSGCGSFDVDAVAGLADTFHPAEWPCRRVCWRESPGWRNRQLSAPRMREQRQAWPGDACVYPRRSAR